MTVFAVWRTKSRSSVILSMSELYLNSKIFLSIVCYWNGEPFCISGPVFLKNVQWDDNSTPATITNSLSTEFVKKQKIFYWLNSLTRKRKFLVGRPSVMYVNRCLENGGSNFKNSLIKKIAGMVAKFEVSIFWKLFENFKFSVIHWKSSNHFKLILNEVVV